MQNCGYVSNFAFFYETIDKYLKFFLAMTKGPSINTSKFFFIFGSGKGGRGVEPPENRKLEENRRGGSSLTKIQNLRTNLRN